MEKAPYDIMQTVMGFNGAVNRATGAFGNSKEVTEFLRLAVGEGGPWTGKYNGANPDKIQTIKVVGYMSEIKRRGLIDDDWRIDWGPCAISLFGKDAARPSAKMKLSPCLDNGAFVAHSKSKNLYVVAIAATNATSLFDWLVEDALVGSHRMVDAPMDLDIEVEKQFTSANPDKSQYTGGTAYGIQILCRQLFHNGKGLRQYFADIKPDEDTRVVFTGHSLAGALAPALAFQLRDMLLGLGWSPENILVLPTAGPTPGNAAFKQDWEEKFAAIAVPAGELNGNNPMSQFNTLYWNFIDPVPHAWTRFDEFHELYDPKTDSIKTKLGVLTGESGGSSNAAGLNAVLIIAKNSCSGSDLAQLRNIWLQGAWPVRYWNDAKEGNADWDWFWPEQVTKDLRKFEAAFALAHAMQYAPLIGIDPEDIPVAAPVHT